MLVLARRTTVGARNTDFVFTPTGSQSCSIWQPHRPCVDGTARVNETHLSVLLSLVKIALSPVSVAAVTVSVHGILVFADAVQPHASVYKRASVETTLRNERNQQTNFFRIVTFNLL